MKHTHIHRAIAALTAAVLLTGAVGTGALAAPADSADIAYVTEQGLFRGVATGQFAPDQPLTCAMAVTVLGRLAKTAGNVLAASPDAPYYVAYAEWAAENKLLDENAQPSPDALMTADALSGILSRYWSEYLGRTDSAPALPSGEQPVTRGEAASVFAAISRAMYARDTTVLTHKAKDGTELTGKLDLPQSGDVERIVLFVNGSGPNTYDNKRQMGETTFQYFDLFAEQLSARGVGFFRWNTRGVSIGDQPPMYDKIDDAAYQTYLPKTSVSDIAAWISVLKQDARLKNAQVYLLGWSEGTIIAPLAAKAYPDQIDGLLLAGYCNDRMDEILDWQQTGGSSMLVYCHYFDADGSGAISHAEFDADPYGLKDYLGATWQELDANADNALTTDDFRTMLAPGYQALKDAIARGDNAWLANNYGVRLTSEWFRAHEKLAPNSQTLPQLSLPIAIFQGTLDANCGYAGAYAISDAFDKLSKTNLQLNIYEGYDHDLNYTLYPTTNTMPQAFEDLFRACGSLT